MRTVRAVLCAVAIAVSVVGCTTTDRDVRIAEAVIADLVEAEPAIRELIKVAERIYQDVKNPPPAPPPP